MFSGTHEKAVIEAGILEKLIDTVIEMAEKDKENVSVKCMFTCVSFAMVVRDIVLKSSHFSHSVFCCHYR